MLRFLPNVTQAPQIDVRKVVGSEINLARVCAYLFKAPYKAMTWCPPREGKAGHMHQSEKGDRYIRYLRMAQIRSMMTFEDATFGGGEGQSIRSGLIKLLRVICEADAPATVRRLHPDAIASFWVQVGKELGKTQWALPVIATQK